MRAKAIVRRFTRQLQRRLVGFGAGVAEEDAVGEGGVDQLLRQPQDRLVGVAVAGMPQARRLFGQRLLQRRVRMTQCVNRNAAGKVDILFAVLIPEGRARCAYRYKVRWRIDRHHPLIEIVTRNLQ